MTTSTTLSGLMARILAPVRALALLATLALALGSLTAGCQDDAEEPTEGDTTAGGEDGDGDRAELEAPPGSVDAEDEDSGSGDMPDGDLETEAGSGGGTGGTGGDTAGGESASGDETAQESPWGTPEAESGRPLPPRRPMNSSARQAYQRGLREAAAGNTAAAQQAFQ